MTALQNPMLRPGRFKLGIFAANCSGGMSVTTVPERWDASWDSNLKLAQMTDAAGLDFLLPIARWIGYGGERINFQRDVLETTTWAAGLLASTRQIAVISTVHTAANNPVVAAKQIATLDRIGHGRAGLNVVAGWNAPEYAALGLDLPADHTTRYAYAQEWLDVVQKLWTEHEAFDFDGAFFHLRGVHSHPKPHRGNVPLINAAGSGEGRAFAVRNADFLFTPAIDLSRSTSEIDALKAQAADVGRKVDVLTFAHVVCRPTEAEARAYYDHYVAATDWAATDNLVNLQFAHAQSFPHDLLALIRERMAAGHGGYPLTGTPEHVADGIAQLEAAGFGGTTLSFVNYVDEFRISEMRCCRCLKRVGFALRRECGSARLCSKALLQAPQCPRVEPARRAEPKHGCTRCLAGSSRRPLRGLLTMRKRAFAFGAPCRKVQQIRPLATSAALF